MSKRYEEPTEVEAPEGSVEAFWWRGRRYHVRQVLSRWREAGGWWSSASDTAQPWARGDAHEIWRVDAQPESANHPAGTKLRRTGPSGTYELCRDLRKGTWTMFRVWD
jgi:uncharacterized protein DUF6504